MIIVLETEPTERTTIVAKVSPSKEVETDSLVEQANSKEPVGLT